MDELDYLYNMGSMMGYNSANTPYYYGNNLQYMSPTRISPSAISAAGNVGSGYALSPSSAASAGRIAGNTLGNATNTQSSPYAATPQSNGGVPYGTMGLGILQLPFAISALHKASKLKYPDYMMTPEMARSVREGNEMRNMGFTGSEYNAYNQALGQDRMATYNRSRELSGGNLASAMMAILNGQNVNARNQMAIQDAALRRQNIAQSNVLNAQTQELANTNTALKIDNINRQKQAAAGLMQSSLGNIASGLNLTSGLGSLTGLPI